MRHLRVDDTQSWPWMGSDKNKINLLFTTYCSIQYYCTLRVVMPPYLRCEVVTLLRKSSAVLEPERDGVTVVVGGAGGAEVVLLLLLLLTREYVLELEIKSTVAQFGQALQL